MHSKPPQIAQEAILRCEKCQGATRVRDTVSSPERVSRIRLCKVCGHTFSTVETLRSATKEEQPSIFGKARSVEPPKRPDNLRRELMASKAELGEWGLDRDDIEQIIIEQMGGTDGRKTDH